MLVKGVAKAFGISEAARMFLSGADLDEGGSAKATSPYKQVSLVFTCINKLINAVSGLPLVLSTIDEKIIESGPAYELLFNNPGMHWSRFVYESIGHYALYRDVFWIFPGKILQDIAFFYEKEIDLAIEGIMALIEPVLIFVLGIGVLIFILSILQPIYGMTGAI